MNTPQRMLWAQIVYEECKGLEIDLPIGYSAMSASELEDWYYDNEGWGAKGDLREGDVETDLPSKDYSRHYECKEVACKCGDKWVGWTYWYGGGKHGEPESIDWIADAYFLDCVEEEVTIVKQTFTIKE